MKKVTAAVAQGRGDLLFDVAPGGAEGGEVLLVLLHSVRALGARDDKDQRHPAGADDPASFICEKSDGRARFGHGIPGRRCAQLVADLGKFSSSKT